MRKCIGGETSGAAPANGDRVDECAAVVRSADGCAVVVRQARDRASSSERRRPCRCRVESTAPAQGHPCGGSPAARFALSGWTGAAPSEAPASCSPPGNHVVPCEIERVTASGVGATSDGRVARRRVRRSGRAASGSATSRRHPRCGRPSGRDPFRSRRAWSAAPTGGPPGPCRSGRTRPARPGRRPASCRGPNSGEPSPRTRGG